MTKKYVKDLLKCKAAAICEARKLANDALAAKIKFRQDMLQIATERVRDDHDLPRCPPICPPLIEG